MKAVWKWILVGVFVMLLYGVWISVFPSLCNGLPMEAAVTVGTGWFLSFELVIVGGGILHQRKQK